MATGFLESRSKVRRWREKNSLAVSSFTIFLLGFGLAYWICHMITVVTTFECEYAIHWVSGWRYFQSSFQMVGVAIALAVLVWVVRIATSKSRNRIETIAQFIFLAGLSGAFLAQKAYLFPYGTPSQDEVERFVALVHSSDLRLEENDELVFDFQADWKFDYPPPPFAQSPEPPGWNPKFNKRLTEIFRDKRSPLYQERKEMWVCYADMTKAVEQYREDQKIWKEYWEGFSEWYVWNRWRYQD